MKDTMSIKLFRTLQKGCRMLSDDAREIVVDFVSSQRLPDDSFTGRGGKSDIYYTAFGWFLSYIMDIKLNKILMRKYLGIQKLDSMNIVDKASYVRCLMLCSLISDDFFSIISNKPSENDLYIDDIAIVSPYDMFLYLGLIEDIGGVFKYSKQTTESMLSEYETTGGFSNVKGTSYATTNATSAALMVMLQNGIEGKIEYLVDVQQPDGGFTATNISPIPDLLSTATALFTISCYGATPKYDASEFIECHWLDTGGFSATIDDFVSDVEYTFYGLLAMGTL